MEDSFNDSHIMCTKFVPNPFKKGFCITCYSMKSNHSIEALNNSDRFVIANESFLVQYKCYISDCSFEDVYHLNGVCEVVFFDSHDLEIFQDGEFKFYLDLPLCGLNLKFLSANCWTINTPFNTHTMIFKNDSNSCINNWTQPVKRSLKDCLYKETSMTNSSFGLVSLEGWLKRSTENDTRDVYAVVCNDKLLLYNSADSYKRRSREPMKEINITGEHNILPMALKSEFVFSVFIKGQKSKDRLYLKASNQEEFDDWMKHLDGIVKRCKSKGSTSSDNLRSSASDHKRDSSPKCSYRIKMSQSTSDRTLSSRSSSKVFNVDSEEKTNADKLMNDNQNLKKSLEEKDEQIKQLKSKLESNETEVKDINEHFKTIQNEKKLSDAENVKLKKENVTLQSEMEKLTTVNKRLKESVSKLEKSVKEKKEESSGNWTKTIDNLKADNDSLKTQLDTSKSELNVKEKQLKDLEKIKEELKLKSDAWEKENGSFKNKLETNAKDLLRLEKENVRLTEKLANFTKLNDRKEDSIEVKEIKKSLTEIKSKVENVIKIKEEIGLLKKNVENNYQIIDKHFNSSHTSEISNGKNNHEYENLKQKLKELELDKATLKKDIGDKELLNDIFKQNKSFANSLNKLEELLVKVNEKVNKEEEKVNSLLKNKIQQSEQQRRYEKLEENKVRLEDDIKKLEIAKNEAQNQFNLNKEKYEGACRELELVKNNYKELESRISDNCTKFETEKKKLIKEKEELMSQLKKSERSQSCFTKISDRILSAKKSLKNKLSSSQLCYQYLIHQLAPFSQIYDSLLQYQLKLLLHQTVFQSNTTDSRKSLIQTLQSEPFSLSHSIISTFISDLLSAVVFKLLPSSLNGPQKSDLKFSHSLNCLIESVVNQPQSDSCQNYNTLLLTEGDICDIIFDIAFLISNKYFCYFSQDHLLTTTTPSVNGISIESYGDQLSAVCTESLQSIDKESFKSIFLSQLAVQLNNNISTKYKNNKDVVDFGQQDDHSTTSIHHYFLSEIKKLKLDLADKEQFIQDLQTTMSLMSKEISDNRKDLSQSKILMEYTVDLLGASGNLLCESCQKKLVEQLERQPYKTVDVVENNLIKLGEQLLDLNKAIVVRARSQSSLKETVESVSLIIETYDVIVDKLSVLFCREILVPRKSQGSLES